MKRKEKLRELDRLIEYAKNENKSSRPLQMFICLKIDYDIREFPELHEAIENQFKEDARYNNNGKNPSGYAICFNKQRSSTDLNEFGNYDNKSYNKLKINFLRRIKRLILKQEEL